MDDARRIEELEIKFAFLEKQAETQDRALYEQEKRVANLEKAVRLLHERLRAAQESGGNDEAPANEKPPHY